jgi:hypothetical protein
LQAISYSPLEESNNNKEIKVEKYLNKEKTEIQLLKLGRSAFAATKKRRSGYFAK